MIFIYDPPQHVSMWMKNTLLPLDMLFVDARGCVVTIKQNAKPGSLATIDSRVPVVARRGTQGRHGRSARASGSATACCASTRAGRATSASCAAPERKTL